MARAYSSQPRSAVTAAVARIGHARAPGPAPAATWAKSQPSSASRAIPATTARSPMRTAPMMRERTPAGSAQSLRSMYMGRRRVYGPRVQHVDRPAQVQVLSEPAGARRERIEVQALGGMTRPELRDRISRHFRRYRRFG